MLNSSSEASEQLLSLTIEQCSSSSFPHYQPLLIGPIQNADQWEGLVDDLQKNLPSTHSLTVLANADATDNTALYWTISDLRLEPPNAFPFSLYVPAQQSAEISALQQLVAVVAQLRNPDGGCPWDLEQTAQTLIPYIIEEAYETVDAIRQGDANTIAEELGDLLLQVVLQAQIASEAEQFSLTDVANSISDKLIRRHPHVFSDVTVNSVDEVHANWDKIKAQEKGQTEDTPQFLHQRLQRYARRLPPLMAGLKLSEKAADAGFEWPDLDGVWAKFYEELSEFQEALLQSNITEQEAELGDLLFTLVNIARWCKLDPAAALHATNQKLIDRIQTIEAQLDKPLSDCSLEELENLWQQAKVRLSTSTVTAVSMTDNVDNQLSSLQNPDESLQSG